MNIEDSPIIENITPGPGATQQRHTLLFFFFAIPLLILAGRSFYLQIISGDTFRARAEHNRVDIIVQSAPRGIIYDRNGIRLVENVSSTDIIFNPSMFSPLRDNVDDIVLLLNDLVPDMNKDHVRESIEEALASRRSILLVRALDHDTVLAIKEHQRELPGLHLVSSLVRKYPHKNIAAHVLGYADAVTGEEIQKDKSLYPSDITGKNGIEKQYDKDLRGTHGITYAEVNASGMQQANLGETPPVPGEDLELTIDIELQEYIHSLFLERSEEQDDVRGSVVAMDPTSGDVLAIVSYPSFDPNVFSQPGLREGIGGLFEDEHTPMFNRAVDGTYSSGSTIKPFVAAAALEEGIISPNTQIRSTGGISIGPWSFADWRAGGHGMTDVKKAIAESVNTFFYVIAGGYEDMTGLGPELLGDYLRMFGLASRTGIDLPSEAPGFIPTPEWKQERFEESWYIGDTYHLGIGQGNVQVTPLQLAASTATIANRGTLIQPHLVKRSPTTQSVDVSREHINTVREGMRQTITEGSGRSLLGLPLDIAGKTGTAQIGGTKDTHAWFSSFGPYEDPDLALIVMLERGGGGESDAAPFAGKIWQWWAEHYHGIEPINNEEEDECEECQ